MGYYADAIKNKKNTVIALIAENFGGVTQTVTALLRRLDKRSCADTTRYGEYSTHDFYGHHAAAISLAIVTGEAEAIVRRRLAARDGVGWRRARWLNAGPLRTIAITRSALQCTRPRGLRAA